MRRVLGRTFTAFCAMSMVLFIAVSAMWVRASRSVDCVFHHTGGDTLVWGISNNATASIVVIKGWRDQAPVRWSAPHGRAWYTHVPNLSGQGFPDSPGARPRDRSVEGGAWTVWGVGNRSIAGWYGDVAIEQAINGKPQTIVVPAWSVSAHYWVLAFLTGAPPAFWGFAFIRRLTRSRQLCRIGLCPYCGYDLRATPDRCPECGAYS